MIIKLDENHTIEDNGSGYTFKITGLINEEGKPSSEIIKYPASLEDAIRLYARFKTINKQEMMTLKQYVDSIKETYQTVIELLRVNKKTSK